jgi:hydrogenase maturation protease
LLEYVETHCDLDKIEILSDFQLQIEHALDLENRLLVLFVDASVSCAGAFDFAALEPDRDKSYTTHAMSPTAVLDVYQSIKKQTPPPCFLLSIKAEKLELGEGLSTQAENNLDQACLFAGHLLQNPDIKVWQQHAKNDTVK